MGFFSSDKVTYDSAIENFVQGWTASVSHQSSPMNVEDLKRDLETHGFSADLFNQSAELSTAKNDDFFNLGRAMTKPPRAGDFFKPLSNNIDTNPYIKSSISALADTGSVVVDAGTSVVSAVGDVAGGVISHPFAAIGSVLLLVGLGVGAYFYILKKGLPF